MASLRRPNPNFDYTPVRTPNWTRDLFSRAFGMNETQWTTLNLAIHQLMETNFSKEQKCSSAADKAKVWGALKAVEREYHHRYFSGCPADFVQKALLGVAGVIQSDRRTGASSAAKNEPGKETEPRRHGPQTTSQSPVPPKRLVVNRDLADCSIATTWSRLDFPALCGITELVPDGAPLDANIAQWDLYVKEIDDQFGSPLGEDKIFYIHEGAVRPVMNNATLRAGLRWMKQDPSLTDNELRFYRWSPEEVRRHINKRSGTVESDDDDRAIDSRRKRRRTDGEDLNQVRKALAEAREKHAALQQQQIERDAQTAEEYAEARTQLQTYIQANETLQKELSNMAGRELELKEVRERLRDVERREAELLGDAARREAELRATIDKLKAQMADLERQCAEGHSRGDNAKGKNSEGSSNGVFDLTADGTNTLLWSNDVPRIPDVNSELGDSDLARDAPQTPALNANPGDNDLSRDASQTPASNASPDDSDPSRDAVDHRCISPLQRIPGWSKDPRSTDLTAHVDVNGTWDEVNNQLQDSSALEQWNEKGWKDFKEFTSYDKAVIDSKATFHIPGIRMPIKFHQYYLVVWQLRRQPETGGGMVGDTMGAGKTFMAFLLITVHAQIQKRQFHVRQERERLESLKFNKTPTRLHLSLKDGQKADAQCPSQHTTFFPCSCVARHWTARIPFNIGAAMIEVKQSLMETVWISHFREMFGGSDHADNIWGVKLRVIHNPTTSSAKGTGLPDYKFTDIDWLHCAGREVDSDGMELNDVSPEREEELALKALDYILLTVPSSQTKEHWNRTLSPTELEDDRGRPTFLNNVIPFAFCIQDEAHELAKDGSVAMQMIAGCNDPTNRMPAVKACPQPYIWFYSGTLWEENPMQECGPKLNMLQKRAERAGRLSWSDPKSPMHKYRIEEVNRLAAQWSSLQKQKVDGTIEPDDFADQLKALVTAQTVILTRFTIKRDKTSTIWDRPLIEMPEQILHRRRCALSEAQHGWVEQADSIERRKARQAARNRIKLWKRQGSKKGEKPTFETQMKSYSVNVSSRSFPSWPALGEVSQRWNDYQGQQARARWAEGQDTYSYAHRRHWSELDPDDQRTAFLLRFTQDEISSYGWDKAGAESPYSWDIDLLMDESPKCRMLHGLMRRLAATKNSDGPSERAAVLSMSPATAKTLYHALADRMFNPDSKWYVGASRVVTWLASGHSRAARTQILNNYNRQHANPAYPNPDVLICTTGKLGVGENLTGGNWLILFEPLNSVTTWKQAAARNVRLGMTEPTHLFQFETDAPYERLMLDRLASRETSQQMVKAVLGEDILRELGMLSKQSARAAGESEESESQHEAAERAGTSNLNLGRRAVRIDVSPNTSHLRWNSMAAGAQRTPTKAVTPMEEFLDRTEDFLAGRTEEGLD